MTEQPVPSNDEALRFLQWFTPGGPWVLTAISTDRKSIQTRTWRAAQERELRAWLATESGRRNLYFHVNPTIRDLDKKAEREDIKALSWLHVDIDPREGESLEDERARALRLLEKPLLGIPAPSAIIFSGGGYQGFWRLETPLPIDGQEEQYELAKRYNIALELAFGADNCHNVDRIMRLPGSINIPDARKLKKGRTATLATIVSLSDAVYPLAKFTPSPPVQMPGGVGGRTASRPGSPTAVEIDGNIPRLADVNELDEWGVPDRVKVIIVQGKHPDETKKDNSRSSWLYDCVCQLVRAKVPDNVIFSVITDPGFGISDSVLDKKPNADRYAMRQIERAKEDAIHPLLREFNERFAVIGNIGGKCMIVEEVPDKILNRSRLTRQSPDSFRQRFNHLLVEMPNPEDPTKPKVVRGGRWWLDHPQRRYADFLVFDPEKDDPLTYNLWRGFGVAAKRGGEAGCARFLDHTLNVICAGNRVHFEFLMNWLARMVQHPSKPGEVAIVLRGGMGVGKSRWAAYIGRLMGRHALQVTNPSHLVGNFNAHLRDCIYLFADEAFYAGDKRHASLLKAIITEDSQMIEAKGVDAEQLPNFIHLVMASNDSFVVPAGMDERRYFVTDVSEVRKQDHEYFREFVRESEGDGPSCLLQLLLERDLTGFNVRSVPQTAALRDQKLHNLTPEQEWWFGKLELGLLLPDHKKWETEVPAEVLQQNYFSHMRDIGVQRRATPTSLGRYLSRLLPDGYPHSFQAVAKFETIDERGMVREYERRCRHYRLPTLDKCRAHFERRTGFAGDWMDASAQGELPVAEKREEPF